MYHVKQCQRRQEKGSYESKLLPLWEDERREGEKTGQREGGKVGRREDGKMAKPQPNPNRSITSVSKMNPNLMDEIVASQKCGQRCSAQQQQQQQQQQ
jgi:hypothetical protein